MRQTFKPGRMTLVSLACLAALTACGGGGGGGGDQGQLQAISFEYPGGGTLLMPPKKLKATTTSGLPVTFASTTPTICTVSGDMMTLVAEGECRVVATQGGGTTADGVKWASADEVSQLFKVLKMPQVIGFLPPDYGAVGSEFALTGVSTSGLPVTFSVSTPNVCSLTGNTVKLLAKGSCAVRATQVGDANYAAALADGFVAVDPLIVADGIGPAGQGSTTSASTNQGGRVTSLPWSSIVGGGWQSSCGNTNNTCFRTVSPDGRIFTSALHVPKGNYGWHDSLHSIDIFAPGLTDFNQSGDTPGLKVTTETTFAMTLGVNKGLYDAKKPIVLHLDLGKRNGNCNVTVSTLLWPNGTFTGVGIPLQDFAVTEGCGLPDVKTVSVDAIRGLPDYTNPANASAYRAMLDNATMKPARDSAWDLIKTQSAGIARVRFRLPDINLTHEDVSGDGTYASDISIVGAIKIQ